MALGKQAGARILARHPHLDALFCANDDLAAGASPHCLSSGISVPDMLALAGFDGLLLTDAMPQRLSTIVTPRYEMGVRAAELFLERCITPMIRYTPERVVISMYVRHGDTTCWVQLEVGESCRVMICYEQDGEFSLAGAALTASAEL